MSILTFSLFDAAKGESGCLNLTGLMRSSGSASPTRFLNIIASSVPPHDIGLNMPTSSPISLAAAPSPAEMKVFPTPVSVPVMKYPLDNVILLYRLEVFKEQVDVAF